MNELKENILRLVGNQPIQRQVCEVSNIDENKCICDCKPTDGSADFLDVRLRSVVDGSSNGFVVIPKDKSLVLVGLVGNDNAEAFVMATSDIEKVILKTDGGITMEWLKDRVNINGDQYGGLVKGAAVTNKLNDLEGELNNLKRLITSWTPVTQDGGSALKIALSTWASQAMTTTKRSDLENDKVKHG